MFNIRSCHTTVLDLFGENIDRPLVAALFLVRLVPVPFNPLAHCHSHSHSSLFLFLYLVISHLLLLFLFFGLSISGWRPVVRPVITPRVRLSDIHISTITQVEQGSSHSFNQLYSYIRPSTTVSSPTGPSYRILGTPHVVFTLVPPCSSHCHTLSLSHSTFQLPRIPLGTRYHDFSLARCTSFERLESLFLTSGYVFYSLFDSL